MGFIELTDERGNKALINSRFIMKIDPYQREGSVLRSKLILHGNISHPSYVVETKAEILHKIISSASAFSDSE